MKVKLRLTPSLSAALLPIPPRTLSRPRHIFEACVELSKDSFWGYRDGLGPSGGCLEGLLGRERLSEAESGEKPNRIENI